jgi:hypothetical protein
MEGLAERLGIGVVAALDAALAAEAGLGHLRVDGIVLAGGAGDGHAQHVNAGHDDGGGGRGGHGFVVAAQEVGAVGRDQVGDGVAVGPASWQAQHTWKKAGNI